LFDRRLVVWQIAGSEFRTGLKGLEAMGRFDSHRTPKMRRKKAQKKKKEREARRAQEARAAREEKK
jgi:hypothetical protein